MDFLLNISAGGYSLFGYILPFLLILTIVVFFHELGHYLVARWNKVDIDAFAVGFGPELFGFNDRHGTRWKFCVIPLGGYVKFSGDANAASAPDFDRLETMSEEQKAGSFEHKNVWQRAAVVVAGPVANFILAIVIFTGSFYFVGQVETDPVISELVEDGAAIEAGFKVGDIIKSVEGEEISTFSQVPRMVAPNHGRNLVIGIVRDGQELEINVVPKLTEREDRFGNLQRIGLIGIISRSEDSNPRVREFSLFEATGKAVGETVFIVQRTFQYLGAIIVGRESADQLSGPIGIAKISGDVATLGWTALINLAAILSVSIGLLNLFPVPMLDGGHLVYYAYEAVFKKPLSRRAQEIGFQFGFFLLIGLMLFATMNDINRNFLQ